MIKNFQGYYKGTIISPGLTFNTLIQDNQKIKKSFYAVLITAVLYTFVYIFLIAGGGQPFKPWLNIPPEIYYRYNVFFCAPSMFIGWMLAAFVTHLICHAITKTGTFTQILGVFGFGISIASWTTGVHDLITSFLGGIHVIDQREFENQLNQPTVWRALLWLLMAAYLIWFIVLFSKGVKAVYQTSSRQSFFAGSFGFVIYQMFFLIFNR